MSENLENKVFKLFCEYMEVWKTKEINQLKKMLHSDIHSYLSVCKYTNDCSQHSLFGMYDFILMMPKTDDFHFEVTNFICRQHMDEICQYAEVACIASDNSGKDFQFVSTFVNNWSGEDNPKIVEMRLDINPISGVLFEEFQKEWLFEPEISILNASVHLPCIFPEMDSPYRYGVGDMGNAEEVIKRYFYGLDQLHFIHVKDVIDDDFEKGKYEYIVKKKFLRQRYRYCSHPYNLSSIQECGELKYIKMESILERYKPMMFTLRKKCGEWKILNIEEDGYGL